MPLSFHRIYKYLISQVSQIKKGGHPVLYRKTVKLLSILWEMSLALLLLPVIIVLRLISSFVLIRFGGLVSSRIGHYAANTELYLCERDTGMQPGNSLDYFFNANLPICNRQLYLMWNRTLRIGKAAKYLYIASSRVPGGKNHMISLSCYDRDVNNLYERTLPHLNFTEEEEKQGYRELTKMGLPQDAEFVLFHARGPAYLKMIYGNADFCYHDYRDSDIDNFIYAAERLAERGYYSFRMGSTPEKAIMSNNPRVIDYASLYRTEFMDIFLGANCRFYIGDPCGVNAVPHIFRKPVASTNLAPIEYAETWNSADLFIPKLHWLEKERRYMSFSEIFRSGAGRFHYTQQYKLAGISLIENSPEDIEALAVEMEERLKGT